MKNLDLNNYGVQELNAKEMRETDGGADAVDWVLWGAGTVAFIGMTVVSGPVGWALFGPTAVGMVIAGGLRNATS